MRKFVLKNALGAEWDLTEISSFLANPKGLGGERKNTYVQVQNSFEVIESHLKQKDVKGEIVFQGYEEHNKFCAFIQHRPLILLYSIDPTTYMMQVAVEKLTKGELESEGLVCDVSFKGLTTWYKWLKAENLQSVEGKIYAYAYPYTYTNTAAGAVEITVDSTESSPMKLYVMGPCVNPSWRHYINGSLAAEGKVICDIGQGNKLVINNTKIPYEIAEYTVGGTLVRNLYQCSDFSTKRFLQAEYGRNKISFMQEGNTRLHAAVEVQVEYAFV